MKRHYWIIALLAGLMLLSVALTRPARGTDARGRPASELTKRVSESGVERRTDYLDEAGNIAFAWDKHYASLVQTRDEEAHKLYERYLDENGAPTALPKGYCAILRTYDAQNRNTDICYLDAEGNPVGITGGYARIRRTYDDADRLTSEYYFDAEDRPTLNTKGIHGFRRDYPDAGRDYRMTYLDLEGQPTPLKAGYAALTRHMNEDGRVAEERYFDAVGAPCKSTLGQYGVSKDYDADGNNVRLTYLGADGAPAPTIKGYASIERVYEAGKLVRKIYLDAQGAPVALARGQYGEVLRDGSWRPTDAQGREIFDLNLYLRRHAVLVFALGVAVSLASLLGGRRWNAALLAGYVLFIAYMTLMYREEVSNRLNLELFWSYRKFFTALGTRRQILFNIWLFVPLGAILYRMTGKPWVVLLAAVGLSVAVEITQYALGIGLCELDDVFSNGLGGAVGCALGFLARDVFQS